jgi:hypothetical protein
MMTNDDNDEVDAMQHEPFAFFQLEMAGGIFQLRCSSAVTWMQGCGHQASIYYSS